MKKKIIKYYSTTKRTYQIKEYLKQKQIRQDKVDLVLSSFSEISKDDQRNELTDLYKLVEKFL